ncbi:MAG: TSUP family transporter [Chitinophagaceae bacterium]
MTTELILLCVAAFTAGFIDAIVGGGGLIQTPAALVLLPQYPVATVIGTLKIPAFTGTFFAAAQYAKRVSFNYKQLALMTSIAFIAAFAGSKLLTVVSNHFMKPLLLVVLIAVAIYTWLNKNFGNHSAKNHSVQREWWYAALISLVIGFYDGFIGPGAGSFLVLSFITLLGFDFLRASAHAKFVNLATNLGSIVFFAASGKIIYTIALPMAVCNGIGGLLGARLALLKGNAFIRILFLIVVTGTIIRFAYDVFFK